MPSCQPAKLSSYQAVKQSSYQALKQSSSQAASVQAATLQSCLAPPSTSWHQSRSHYHRGAAESSFTAMKWFGHGGGRSPCAHSMGKFSAQLSSSQAASAQHPSCHPAWQSSYQALKQSSSQAASVQAATLQSCLAPPSTSWHQSRSHYHRGCICTLGGHNLATMLSSCPAAKLHLLSIQAATLLGSLATKQSS